MRKQRENIVIRLVIAITRHLRRIIEFANNLVLILAYLSLFSAIFLATKYSFYPVLVVGRSVCLGLKLFLAKCITKNKIFR